MSSSAILLLFQFANPEFNLSAQADTRYETATKGEEDIHQIFIKNCDSCPHLVRHASSQSVNAWLNFEEPQKEVKISPALLSRDSFYYPPLWSPKSYFSATHFTSIPCKVNILVEEYLLEDWFQITSFRTLLNNFHSLANFKERGMDNINLGGFWIRNSGYWFAPHLLLNLRGIGRCFVSLAWKCWFKFLMHYFL